MATISYLAAFYYGDLYEVMTIAFIRKNTDIYVNVGTYMIL